MSNTMTASDYTAQLIASYKVFEMQREEPEALINARQRAIRHFEQHGLPTRKHEEWKYTNIGKYLKEGFAARTQLATEEATSADLDWAAIPELEANRLVFINGRYDAGHSEIKDAALQFTPINEAIANGHPAVMEAVEKVVNAEKDPFIWLNEALFTDGTVIEVADKAELQYPVYLIHIEKPGEQPTLDCIRNIMTVGKNTKVQVIQNYLNGAGQQSNLANHLTQVAVGENSIVEWYNLQYHLDNALHLSNFEATIQRNARFANYVFTTSGELVRNTSNMKLLGEGADAHMYGLYQFTGSEHVDNRTLVDHAVPHCTSDELYKGIMDGTATAVFNGKIIVRPDAQKTNAFQHNPNIILSDDAAVYSKPQLEIFADDVKCSHGATSGQLDEDALFYLQQRGLSLDDARGLLTYAFANEVIDKVNVPALQAYLQKTIQGNLLIH